MRADEFFRLNSLNILLRLGFDLIRAISRFGGSSSFLRAGIALVKFPYCERADNCAIIYG
jgi:hypothetical protein